MLSPGSMGHSTVVFSPCFMAMCGLGWGQDTAGQAGQAATPPLGTTVATVIRRDAKWWCWTWWSQQRNPCSNALPWDHVATTHIWMLNAVWYWSPTTNSNWLIEPCFFWLLNAYTLMGGLCLWLRKAWICAKVGFARLRGLLLPSRTGFARALV